MDRDFDRGNFRETSRDALMWRESSDPGMVNLVLRSGAQGRLPEEMAWVFPLPSLPVEYREVEGGVFSELKGLFEKILAVRGGADDGIGAEVTKGSGIVFHEVEKVGDYEIVPIEITDESDGGRALNEWLLAQGYATLPAEIQKPYLGKGAVFLAVKVRPKSGDVELQPLLVKYRAREMRFPLRFSHDDRTFDMDLYFVHGGDSSEISGVPGEKTYHMTVGVEEAIRECPELGKILRANKTDKITRVSIRGINSEFPVRNLKEDPGID